MTTLYNWQQDGWVTDSQYGRLARLANELDEVMTSLQDRYISEVGYDSLAIPLSQAKRAVHSLDHAMDIMRGRTAEGLLAHEPDPHWLVSIDTTQHGRKLGLYANMPASEQVTELRAGHADSRVDLYRLLDGAQPQLVRRWEPISQERVATQDSSLAFERD